MRNKIPSTLVPLVFDQQLSTEAIRYIERSNVPSTQPNGRFSYTVRYPCALTGEILELQSRDFEFACLLTLKADPNLAFIIPQPAKLELNHSNARAKFYAPDFLAIWKDKRPPTLFETKPSRKLSSNVAKYPDRYTSDGPNSFDMPLAREAASSLGFDFRVIHEGHFTETFIRNILLLEPYRNWPLEVAATDEERKTIKDQIVAQPGIKFSEIVHESSERRADLIHHMLANGEIFANLSEDSLLDQNRVGLFNTRVRERALALFNSKTPIQADRVCPYVLSDGQEFVMRGKHYTIVKCSGKSITIRNWKGQESQFPIDSFIAMLPEVDAFNDPELTPQAQLFRASDKDIAEMMRRYEIVRPYVDPAPGEETPTGSTSRTLQRYLAEYRQAQATHGSGVLGLLPKFSKRGSKAPIYPRETMDVMNRVITRNYLKAHPRPTMVEAHCHLTRLIERMRLGSVPSYRTFVRACKRWDAEFVAQRRWGHRYAKQYNTPSAERSPLGAPHGYRPFTVAHCDHTTNDLSLDHPESEKKLLKAHHSTMVDATTHKVLGHVTRLESPSTETLIELFKDCYRRHSNVPSLVIVDWGTDFRSKWFQETLGQVFKSTIVYRQIATATSGSPVEGQFRSNDVELVHRMTGSTEALKKPRLTTGSMLPNRHSIWTLKDLREIYEDRYRIFNSTPQGTSKISPDEKEAELWNLYGSHPLRAFPADVLERVLLPLADGIYRVVDSRCRILVNRTYYASGELTKIRRKQVTVRTNPSDPRAVYVAHPDLKGIVTCRAVSADVKYSMTPDEAMEVTVLKNTNDPEASRRKAEGRAELSETRENTEKRLKKESRKKKKPKPPSPDSGEKSDENSNVVNFEYTQGGLRVIRKEGGCS